MYEDNFIVALCMDGNIYIIAKDHGKLEPKVLVCDPPNKFIVDVAVAENRIIARSNTERLYISYSISFFGPPPPNKLVEFDLGSALGLPNKPRILAMTPYSWRSFACLVEDVGILELRYNYAQAPEVDIVPRVSKSLEPDWDVVDMTWGGNSYVLLLSNGLVYKLYPLKETSLMEPQLLNFSEPIERVWSNNDGILALSRTKVLFQRDYWDHRWISHSSDHEAHHSFQQKVEGIDAARISSISIGRYYNIALMDDGTAQVWGKCHSRETPEFGLGKYQDPVLDKAVNIDLEHVVYVTASDIKSLVIVMDPNKPGETDAASW